MNNVRTANEWKAGHVAFFMLLGAPVVAGMLVSKSGVPAWLVLTAIAGCLFATFRYPALSVGPLRGKGLKITLIAVLLCSLVVLPVIALEKGMAADFDENMKVHLARASSDPDAEAAALRETDETIVEALARRGVNLASAELARRKTARAEAQRREHLALEARNEGAIHAELARLDAIDADDGEARLAVWRKLASLAPANPRYRKEVTLAKARIAEQERMLESPGSFVKIVRQSGRKGGFNNVYLLDVTVKNSGILPVKDMVVIRRTRAPSGTQLDALSTTIYEVVEPGQMRRFRNINLGLMNPAANRSSCFIFGAVPA